MNNKFNNEIYNLAKELKDLMFDFNNDGFDMDNINRLYDIFDNYTCEKSNKILALFDGYWYPTDECEYVGIRIKEDNDARLWHYVTYTDESAQLEEMDELYGYIQMPSTKDLIKEMAS